MNCLKKIATVGMLGVLSISMMTLQGCAHSKQEYLKQSASTPALTLPRGVHTHPLENQFPVPPMHHANQPAPSLVPPGADLSQYASQKHHR